MATQALLSQMWNLNTNQKPAAVTELNGLKSTGCQTDPVVIIYSVQPSCPPAQRETPIKRPPLPAQHKKAPGPPSTQPEPNDVLIAGNPNTVKPDHGKIKDCDVTKYNPPIPEKPLIAKRDNRKRDSSPPPADAFPKPQKRRLMVKRSVPSQEAGEVRAGHRQSDGSFQQASLSRFVAPTGPQRPEFKTPMEGVARVIESTTSDTNILEPLPPPRRLPANALRIPTPGNAANGTTERPHRLQRSSCSTAIATDAVAAAASLIFGEDYTTPIPIRRRNTTAVDSSLHVPAFTPLCENPANGVPPVKKGHRWSTPINPEGQEEVTCGGGKAAPTLPSLQAPRRKRDVGANLESLSSAISTDNSGCPMPIVVRKRPRPNSCASESSEHRAMKRTRTTSLL